MGRVVEEVVEERESPLRVILAQALGKKDRFEWVIQKAVELGASEIVPLITCHSEVHLNQERAERKMQRWGRIALEAVKQSRRSRLPKLSPLFYYPSLFPKLQCLFDSFLMKCTGAI